MPAANTNKASSFSQMAPFRVRGSGYAYMAPQIGSIPIVPITPSENIYLRPDGTSFYLRPASVAIYIRP